MAEFLLDPRLAADSSMLLALPIADVRLSNDARFPWLILVPRVAGAVEMTDLSKPERAYLFEEITLAANALRDATRCEKINIGALGNIVRQLHVHVVARFAGDAAWPGPVWGSGPAVAYDPGARDRLADDIRTRISASRT